MKTLLLMRHAKSSWDTPGLRDFDRPLNGRGLNAAPLMGRYLRAQGIRPDLILSSPANRAQHTAQLVKEAAQFAAPIHYEAGIYEASIKELLHALFALEEEVKTVLLIGHNPGFNGLLGHLSGVHEPLTTASIAHLALNTDTWPAIRAGCGQLIWLVKPRQLTADE